MTVAELVAKLLTFDQDLHVVVSGYEGDLELLKESNVQEKPVRYKGYHSDYFGDLEEVSPSDLEREATIVASEDESLIEAWGYDQPMLAVVALTRY